MDKLATRDRARLPETRSEGRPRAAIQNGPPETLLVGVKPQPGKSQNDTSPAAAVSAEVALPAPVTG